ncbi:MAG: calcium/sodium antiporter [Gammaproteobacteria bacterium]|nr:calcium/sodium antiporter [Gammaproteobacteria bacterium]
MWLSLLAVIAGFALLVWSADRFVMGASATARNLGVAPIIIGLTVVGLGTSAPEILVSAMAAWNGNPHMGIGNALGSNIANIGLVLGITALVAPLAVHSQTLRREFPIMFAVIFVALILLWDGELTRLDGLLLLFGMALVLSWMVYIGLQENRSDPMDAEYEDEIPSHIPMRKAVIWIVIGLSFLLLSSHMLVWGAVNIAKWFGLSDLIIGLTIIAIGTSLPELAASVTSALKNEHDIAIGNILGSNMFNLLAVLSMPGLIQPGTIPAEVLSRDYPVMLGLSILLLIMAYGFKKPGRLSRPEGALLLMGYIAYMGFLYYTIIR